MNMQEADAYGTACKAIAIAVFTVAVLAQPVVALRYAVVLGPIFGVLMLASSHNELASKIGCAILKAGLLAAAYGAVFWYISRMHR